MVHLNTVSGRIETDAEDNHHSFIFLCSSDGGYAFLSNAALSNTTLVAKSICKSNSVQRIVATCSFADISEVSTFEAFNLVKLKEVLWIR